MTTQQQQIFKACFVGNPEGFIGVSHEELRGLPIYFAITSNHYALMGRELTEFPPVCILTMAYDLWRYLRYCNWNMCGYDAEQQCDKIKACFSILGLVPDDYKVDYAGMQYLDSTLPSDEDYFDRAEQEELLKLGNRKIDIELYNAAMKCDIWRVQKLMNEGAQPLIKVSESQTDNLAEEKDAIIGALAFAFEDYYEACYSNEPLSNDMARNMLEALYEMACATRVVRILCGVE